MAGGAFLVKESTPGSVFTPDGCTAASRRAAACTACSSGRSAQSASTGGKGGAAR